jgi:steroid 5-alpha reductase family enzyme
MAAVLSLPALKSVSDCADYTLTVQPYIPQLLALPSNLLTSMTTNSGAASKLDAVANVYASTNPLVFACFLSLALAPLFLLVSEVNRNYSQVDRVWSILPALYIIHYDLWARQNALPSAKLDAAALCATIWSCRLTFNYWRKGGYTIGSEDYRWNIIKAKIGAPIMFLMNVTFISLGQSVCFYKINALCLFLTQSCRSFSSSSRRRLIYSSWSPVFNPP